MKWTRQSNKTYIREGERPACRRVRIAIDGREGYASFRLKEAIEIVETAIAKGQVRAGEYRLVPLDVAPMENGKLLVLERARFYKWLLTTSDEQVSRVVAWG